MALGVGPERSAARTVNFGLGALALLLLLAALGMGERWAERHFLPTWSYGWETQLRILFWLRLAVGGLGLSVLLLLRPWARHAVAAGRGRQALAASLSAAAAIALAFVAVEGILHTRSWRSTQERWDREEPLRAPDAEYGWTFVPDHAGTAALHGRIVHYDTGTSGYRIARPGATPDFRRATIILAGESVMLGYGLQWPETIAARLEAVTGLQTVNLAVNAHATDQSYMRLRRELPRFAHLEAVVIPFVPALVDRNLDADRPHLDAQLRWHAAGRPSLRLIALARRAVRYRSEAAIAEGLAMTQSVLRRTIAIARRRGARPLIMVPQFLPEAKREAEFRRMVLDDARIPYLLVPIRSEWRFAIDRHPTPRGARAIADAIAEALAAATGDRAPPGLMSAPSRLPEPSS
jgi:hypothetical protein